MATTLDGRAEAGGLRPDTGDLTVTTVGGVKNDRIDAGKAKLIVEASECGIPYANVHITGTANFVDDSGGHIHSVAGAVNTPPGTEVAKFPALTGDTDANGRLEIPGIVAGEFAGQYEVEVETADLRVPGLSAWPAKSAPSRLTVGFRNLRPLDDIRRIPFFGEYLWTLIKPVGQNNQTECVSQLCDNHKDVSQYGHRELLRFIVNMAVLYKRDVDHTAVLPINDMSLPTGGAFEFPGNWVTKSHITHRIGIDVDVNASTMVNGKSLALKITDLTDIVKTKLKGKRLTEPKSIHYRIPKPEIDAVVGEVK